MDVLLIYRLFFSQTALIVGKGKGQVSYMFSRDFKGVFAIVKNRRNQNGYNYLTKLFSFLYYYFLKAKIFMRPFYN